MNVTAVDDIKLLPVMVELDASPSVDVLNKAIDSLARCNEGILRRLSMLAKVSFFFTTYTSFSCTADRKGPCPRTSVAPVSLTLYKKRGDHSDCKNYRGISLFRKVGKDFAPCSTEQVTGTRKT